MADRESWAKMVINVCSSWVSEHRVLLYIAFVVTVTLAVQLFDISLVGK